MFQPGWESLLKQRQIVPQDFNREFDLGYQTRAAEGDLPVSVETDEVEDLLPMSTIEAREGMVVSIAASPG